MSGLGLAETIGALVFGRLSDRVGTLAILLIGGLIQIGAFFLVYHASEKQDYTLYLGKINVGRFTKTKKTAFLFPVQLVQCWDLLTVHFKP